MQVTELMPAAVALPIQEPLPVREAHLVVTPHPFTTQGQTSVAVLMHDGETLLAVMRRYGVTSTWIVEVGGLQVPALLWGRTRVHHGQVIECRHAVQKDAIRLAALVVLAVYAPQLAAALLPAGASAFAVGLTVAAINVAGSVIINKLLPPPSRGVMDTVANTTEPTYSLSGGRNQARLWQPMALVLGQPYCVPDLAGQPYTYFGGEDQYLVQQFHAGINCHTVSALRIGQTGLEDYQDVTVRAYGLPGSSLPGGLPANSVDSIAGGLLDAPTGTGPWVQRTSSINTLKIAIDLEASLYGVAANGAYEQRAVALNVQYAVAGSGNWVDVGTGTSHREQRAGSPVQILDGEGGFTGQYEAGPLIWVNVPDVTGVVTLTHASAKPLRTQISIDVPAGQYDVRMRKVTANETSTQASNSVQWSQLKSFQQDLASYPGQSIVAVSIKASGQINGALDEFNYIATAKPMPYWDGSAWTTATDRTNGLSNPGAQILQLARGIFDANGKLIAGLGWPDNRIDVEGLKRFMVWCAAKGLTFDSVIQEAMSHDDLLTTIAYAGMATPSSTDGRLGVQWLDDAQPIEGVINMGNIKARSFSVSYDTQDRAEEIEYGFFDRARSNTWNSLRVLAPGVTNPRSTARLSNAGITTEAHAVLLARHAMAQNIYMAKTIVFEQDLEYMTYKRGTVLALSHDMTQWGYSGRVQLVTNAAGVITLALDDEILATSPSGSTNRFVGLRLVGERQYRIFSIVPFSGRARSVTLVGAWPAGAALPGANGQPMDALWIYDFKATPGARVVVQKIEPGDNQGGARVTVVPLPTEFWPFVLTGAYTPPTNNSLINTKAVVTGASITEVLKRQGNTFVTELTVAFDLSASAGSVRVYGAANGAPLAYMGTTPSREFTWTGGLSESWDLELRPFNNLGQLGTSHRVGYVVQGLTTPPDNVANLGLVIDNTGVRITWSQCVATDYAATIVKVGSSWASATEVSRKNATSHLLGWAGRGALTVWAAHVDTSGNVSLAPASVSFSVAVPGAPDNLMLVFGTSSIEASWVAPTVSANQQPLDRVELSWAPEFTSIIDAKQSSTTTFGWMAAGSYTLWARYVDVAGNVGEVSQNTMQVLPPAQPAMTATEVQVNAVTLRWQNSKTSQPIKKYSIFYAEAGTAIELSLLYGSAGADSRSDLFYYRSSRQKVAYLVAEDVAGNTSEPRQIDVTITMPNDFVLASEFYADWQPSELVNGTIIGGSLGRIILPSHPARTWGERLTNSGWSTAQQKVDAGYPIVVQPVPTSAKHVENRDLGKVLSIGVVRVVPTLQSSVPGYVATIRIRGSVGSSSTVWQPWLVGDSASVSDFQFLEVEYSVTSDGMGFVVLEDLYVKVEITQVSESAVLVLDAADATGTPYTTSKVYLDVQTAIATPLNSPGIHRVPNCIIDDSQSPTVVRVMAHDSAGTRVSGTVSLTITGV